MTIDLRVLEADQWDHFFGRLERAFGGPPDSAEQRAGWREVTELERSLAVWDDGEIVGTAGAFSFRMTVPGGALLDIPGVTMVSVQATHRRRGVLTAMMRHQLDEFHQRGEAVAALTASEPAIYGRFGYGIGSRQLQVAVDTNRVGLTAPPGTDAVRMRVVSPTAGREPCEAVYAALVPTRPGLIARRPGWFEKVVVDSPADRQGTGELLCVLAEVDGEVRGYARYAVKSSWDFAGADGAVMVRDLDALGPVACAALWRYLAAIDLTSSVAAVNRPTDDPVQHMVSDPRRCDLRVRDALHVRLVDVPAALESRTYSTPVDVVLDVEDAFCPWNTGRWRLTGDPKGASCARTTDPADLALTAKELAAAYLGGTALSSLAAAGLVRELRPGALTEASTAFRGDVQPWLPHGF